MAQPALPAAGKLRIRLKGVHTKTQATHKGPVPPVKADLQLQDLRAAVAEFSMKGINGLPGGVMMGAWIEDEVLQEQQFVVSAAPAAAHQQAPRAPRVRKRRAAAAAEFSLADMGLPYVVWGRSKRQRTQQQTKRRNPAQVRGSLHRLLAAGSRHHGRRPHAPAAAHAPTPAVAAAVAAAEQPPQVQQQQQQGPVELPAQQQQQPQELGSAGGLRPLSPQLQPQVQPVPQTPDLQAHADALLQPAGVKPAEPPLQPVPVTGVEKLTAAEPSPQQRQERQEGLDAKQQLPPAVEDQMPASNSNSKTHEPQQQQQPVAGQPASAGSGPAASPEQQPAQPDELSVPAADQQQEGQAHTALQSASKHEALQSASKHEAQQQPVLQEQTDKQQPQKQESTMTGAQETAAVTLQQDSSAALELPAGTEEQQAGQQKQLSQKQKQKAGSMPDSTPAAKKARVGKRSVTTPAAATDVPAAAAEEPAAGAAAANASSTPAAAGVPAAAVKTASVEGLPGTRASPAKAASAAASKAADKQAQPAKAASAAKVVPAGKTAASPTKPKDAASAQSPAAAAAAAAATTPVAASKAPAAAKTATPAEAAPAAAIEQETPPAAQAAAAAVKPESPPSETSHQQPIAASVPQHVQKLQSPLQPVAPQLPQEQTAVSRDRSQCSLQQPAESPAAAASAGAAGGMTAGSAATAAAAMRGFGVLATAGLAAGAPKSHLLELEASAMSPAALALGSMTVPTVSFRQVLPDKAFVSQEEAAQYLDSMLVEARKKKHTGDHRCKQQGGWDVHSLTYYAYSALEFLRYWDACQKAMKQLGDGGKPFDSLKKRFTSLTNIGLLKQVNQLCCIALQNASNCKGQDVQKQALRMLLERLSAICQMKHLHSQRESLQQQAHLLKGTIPLPTSSNNSAASSKSQQQQQQQQGQRVQATGKPPARAVAAAASAAVVGGGSPHGKQAFDKRSPDDSNTSNQDRVQLTGLLGPEQQSPGLLHGSSQGGGHGAGGGNAAAGGSGPGASERMLMVAESTCAEHLGELLKITDGMHQTVMRMQQFLESPEVLADEDARAAALHISTLGLDAGMFSIPRVVAHAEAALVRVVRSGRRGMVRMTS